MTTRLRVLPDRLAVCRLDAAAAVPEWSAGGGFASVTRTPSELSVVCGEDLVPAQVRAERGWRALGIVGTLDFGLVGVVLSIARPLAEAGVSLFVISTFDTDYVLVKEDTLDRALAALGAAGFTIER